MVARAVEAEPDHEHLKDSFPVQLIHQRILPPGEWAGLCKIDSDGNAKKVVGASCVVVHDCGEDSEGLNWLRNNVSN